jgi:hypothetical protein
VELARDEPLPVPFSPEDEDVGVGRGQLFDRAEDRPHGWAAADEVVEGPVGSALRLSCRERRQSARGEYREAQGRGGGQELFVPPA